MGYNKKPIQRRRTLCTVDFFRLIASDAEQSEASLAVKFPYAVTFGYSQQRISRLVLILHILHGTKKLIFMFRTHIRNEAATTDPTMTLFGGLFLSEF